MLVPNIMKGSLLLLPIRAGRASKHCWQCLRRNNNEIHNIVYQEYRSKIMNIYISNKSSCSYALNSLSCSFPSMCKFYYFNCIAYKVHLKFQHTNGSWQNYTYARLWCVRIKPNPIVGSILLYIYFINPWHERPERKIGLGSVNQRFFFPPFSPIPFSCRTDGVTTAAEVIVKPIMSS